MSGDEFACYMMISTLIFGRAGPVPERETRAKLQTIFNMRPRLVEAVIDRLARLGKLTIAGGMMMTELAAGRLGAAAVPPPRAAVSPPPPLPAPPRREPPKPACRPTKPAPQEKTNGFALDLFPETLPKPPPPPPPPPDPIPIPPKPAADPPKLPLTPQQVRDAARPEFDRWYGGYPNKKAPEAALRAFIAARKKATLDELIAGRDRYAAEVKGQDKHLIKHPATWLNGGCWKDEPDRDPRQEDRAWV